MKPLYSSIGWILLYLLLVLAPLFVLLIGEVPPGSGFRWDFSMALGFSAMAIMSMLFFLTARFRRATAPFGIDIIYYFHRYLALLAFVFLVAHYLIIRLTFPDALGPLNPFTAPWHMTAGRVSLLMIVILIVSSLWRQQLRIHYDEWRILHIVLAVAAFILAFSHIVGVGYYVDAPAKKLLWLSYTLFWLMLGVYVRLIKPWRMKQKPYQVVELNQKCCNSWTLAIEAQGHKGIKFKPGQFAWLTLRESPWHIKEHPFSISSGATRQDRLEFTIKELGDFTSKIKEIKPGELAYLDGPYGVFSVDNHPDSKGFVFIAGGVGAAPIMSMLRTLADREDKRPLWFIYANKTESDVIFGDELEELTSKLNLNLTKVLTRPVPDWQGESGYITQDMLRKVLPNDAVQYEYFLCGPKPMSDKVQQSLLRMHVPLGKIHFEIFNMV